jgi:glucosamine-phosphate N-acetyltransferase
MTVQVRNAVATDHQACIELLQELRAADRGPLSVDAGDVFEQLLDGVRGRVLVAEDDGELLGLASVTFNLAMRYGGEYCQLEELVVDPAARGKHVGARLVEAAVEQARERGCAEIGAYLVAATEHNRPFYEKFGFTAVGTEMRQILT